MKFRIDIKSLRERKIKEIEEKLRRLQILKTGHRAPQQPEPMAINKQI